MDGGGAAVPDAAVSTSARPNVADAPAGIWVENCYVLKFKCWLQEYTQKVGIPNPEYHTLKEGPSNPPVFKCTVFVNNTRYDIPRCLGSSAGRLQNSRLRKLPSCLMEIATSVPVTEYIKIIAIHETGLCKSLLQEYAQKI